MSADNFLDTSVIVRYLTGDPPGPAESARGIIDGAAHLTLTDVVLTESTYVLTSLYRLPREVTIDGLIGLIGRQNISVYSLDKDTVIRGLLMCRGSGRVSVSDAMIWAAANSAGATTVFSFDRRFPSDGMSRREAL